MIEEAVRQAIIAELQRQASDRLKDLSVIESETTLWIDGPVQLDELVMAIVGAVAGGP
jgi:hypothetical protein